MRITGYESENGKVTAITVTDETRGFYDKRFEEERPRGEWVRGVRDHYFVQMCSVCDKTYRLTKQTATFNFCPNCGADMKAGEAE